MVSWPRWLVKLLCDLGNIILADFHVIMFKSCFFLGVYILQSNLHDQELRLAPMAHSVRLWLETQMYWVRIPAGLDICHRVVIQCSKLFKGLECAVLSMVLCTIKNPWSHPKRVGHSPDFERPSVAILPWLCRKRRKAIFTHSLTTKNSEIK